MGFRFRKQIKILPGIKLNLSKNGISSVSIGKAGATLNLSGKGAKLTTGLPGTGISFSQQIKGTPNSQYQPQTAQRQAIAETFFPCPSCGAPCKATFSFCTSCGLDLAEEKQRLFYRATNEMQCPKCKKYIKSDSMFCTECGYDFVRAVQNDIVKNYIDLFEDGEVGITYLSLGQMYESHAEYFNAMVCYVYAWKYGFENEAVEKLARFENQYGYNAQKILRRIDNIE